MTFLFCFLLIFLLRFILSRFFIGLVPLAYAYAPRLDSEPLFLSHRGAHVVCLFFSCNLTLIFCGLISTSRLVGEPPLPLFTMLLSSL